MPTGYHHLTHCERCQICTLLHRGLSKREIARELGRDPGTISRETSRNRGQRGYRHKQAHGKATTRRREASSVPRKMTPGRWEVVEGRLKEGWSPEQIAGRYRRQGEVMAGKEWIYQHVRGDRRAGGTLYLHLRRRGKKPNAAGVMPDGATYPAGWTLRIGLRWWRRSAGSGTGSLIRSSGRGTGVPWCRRWTGDRS